MTARRDWAVAQEYVAQSLADMDMARVIGQMRQPLVRQIEGSTGKALTPDQPAKIDTLYQETFAEKMTRFMSAQDAIMADLLTLPELEALRDFYASEAGRSVMIKLPDVLAKQQPLIMTMAQESMPVVMPKLQEIVVGQ